MAQLPGYLRPATSAAASPRPASLLDILGSLGPREAPVRARAGQCTSVPAAVVAASVPARRGVGAPGHG
ncbi:hypothetical protein [Patulibacter americanus]|uniref:hypothetical protein n=1 Tax=Patulibacter americanus TaxID=588672 RepID=UPI0003B62D3D|nr:hypothetical protein [Patulibacter americanus]